MASICLTRVWGISPLRNWYSGERSFCWDWRAAPATPGHPLAIPLVTHIIMRQDNTIDWEIFAILKIFAGSLGGENQTRKNFLW